MIEIPHLEWHVTHSCNFTCEGCGHYTNDGYKENISLNTLKEWYSLWCNRIKPKEISLLGGEPLLNRELVDIIYTTKEVWNIQNTQYFELVSNALLLHKQTDLPKALKETNCVLCITIHSRDENYLRLLKKSIELVDEWVKEYGIVYFTHDATDNWLKAYKGYGKTIQPYEDNDYETSWNNCPTGQENFQLLDGKIYKCAPLAYLPLQKKKYKDELSKKWDPYLKYIPLTSDATDDEIIEFFSRCQESVCGMCPNKPQTFQKKSPLHSPGYMSKIIQQ